MSEIQPIPILLILLFTLQTTDHCKARSKPDEKCTVNCTDQSGNGSRNGHPQQNGERQNTTNTRPDPSSTPPKSRESGFLNPSLYQVFVTVFAREEKEARRIGLSTARQKTLNLWRKYLPDDRVPGDRTLREMRRIIERDARINHIKKESDGTWSIWIQIARENLQSEIRNLR